MIEERIVVGIDGSRAAEHALLWAAGEATRRSAHLTIAHAGDIDAVPLPGGALASEYARSLLLDAVATVFENACDCDIDTLVRDESAVTMLTDLSREADLVVVGSHGLGRTAGTVLGSVAFRVAAHARCPVAVVEQAWRESPDQANSPIAVGVSSTATGVAALEFAFAEAELRRVDVRAVRSWADIDKFEALPAELYATESAFHDAQQELAERILAPLRERHPSVGVQLVLGGDAVATMLSQAAASAAMLVVGCRYADNKSLSRLGPTASRMLHVVQAPVIVVGWPHDNEHAAQRLDMTLSHQL